MLKSAFFLLLVVDSEQMGFALILRKLNKNKSCKNYQKLKNNEQSKNVIAGVGDTQLLQLNITIINT